MLELWDCSAIFEWVEKFGSLKSLPMIWFKLWFLLLFYHCKDVYALHKKDQKIFLTVSSYLLCTFDVRARSMLRKSTNFLLRLDQSLKIDMQARSMLRNCLCVFPNFLSLADIALITKCLVSTLPSTPWDGIAYLSLSLDKWISKEM